MRVKIACFGRRIAALRIAVLAVVLAGASLGCGGATRPESPFGSGAVERLDIEVLNHNFLDVTLYAVWPGKRIRLGTVVGTRSASFRLPWEGTELLQIEINQLAGPSCVTEQIMAVPGEVIFIEIPSHLQVGKDCYPRR
jgi:hypothetical protein